ncbi:MAG TPA: NAD(P)-binding domain-containing protein [Cellulomonas sp.]
MTAIAFIGLGIMGRPMALHLIHAGHDVTVRDRHDETMTALVAEGGHASASVAEAVSGADVVITMVQDSPDVQGAALGPDGIYANCRPGILHIDCSTIRPDVAREVAAAGRAAGVRVLDAPVSGGQQGAVNATLSIMVGGEPADFAEAKPLLDVLGKTVRLVGAAGAGQTVKAANQLIVAGTIELVAESIVFLEAYGVDTTSAVEVLAGGLAGNAILTGKSAGMLARRFEPGFRVDLHHKDLGIVTAAAREAGVAIPLGAHVAQLMGSLRAQGHGTLDHTALLLQVEELSGRGTAGTPQV